MLRRNLWLVFAATALALAATAFFILRQERNFEARAVIRVADIFGSIGGVQGEASQASGKDIDPLQSELTLLEEETVLGETVDRLGLRLFDASTKAPAPYLQEAEVSLLPHESRRMALDFGMREVAFGSGEDRESAAYGDTVAVRGVRFTVPEHPDKNETTLLVVPRHRAIDYVRSSLEAERRKGTSTIDITFESQDSTTALNVVNSVVRVFQEVQARVARQEAMRRREFFEAQLRKTDSLLNVAQARLSAYRSREQAYSAGDRFVMELGELVEFEMRQQELEENRRIYNSFLSQVLAEDPEHDDTDLDRIVSLPGGIADDPAVSELYSQITQQKEARDSLTTGRWAVASTHPNVQRLDTLISSTREELIDAARGHIASVGAQIEVLDRFRGRSVAQMSQLASAEVEEARLMRDLEDLMDNATELRTDYQAARLQEAVAGEVEIIEPANRAARVPRHMILPLLVALAVGLMLGTGAAFAREKLDDSISRQEEVENLLMAPNLAVIPGMGFSGSGALLSNGDVKPGSFSLQGAGIEAYRSLRTNLTFSRSLPPLKTLVVTSAIPGEGKSMTAVNLAIVYAWQGLRVLLMDCDFRRPHLGQYFENRERSEVDLPMVLAERRDPRSAIISLGIDGVDLLPVNGQNKSASELLGSAAMKDLLRDLSGHYDLIILDSPPLLAASDAAVLGAMTDGVLLVIRAGYADRGAVQLATKQLTHVGARIVGAVLNDPESRVPRYDGQYAYSYTYAAEP
ncbi:MAG: polysaccharide biosynthesis tyrosine autokinase [Gemmatimonadota bacterium]